MAWKNRHKSIHLATEQIVDVGLSFSRIEHRTKGVNAPREIEEDPSEGSAGWTHD
jgi:hypothetical protein